MTNNLLVILQNNHPIFDALKEIQKPRSRFQLEKFVVEQHDTEEQQYKQCLLELQQLIYTYKVVSLQLQKQTIEIERLKATGDEIDSIEAQIKELNKEQTLLTMLGTERELKDLIEIWEKFEHKFTYEEMEELQPVYWKNRLSRQAHLEAIGSDGKIGWASLDALRQIGELKFTDTEIIEDALTKELEQQ